MSPAQRARYVGLKPQTLRRGGVLLDWAGASELEGEVVVLGPPNIKEGFS